MYTCSKCHMSVIVTPEATVKACKCEAPITANMVAVAHGKSSTVAKVA